MPEEGSVVSEEGLVVEARGENLLAVVFTAMASPCEVLVPSMDRREALALGMVAAQEAWRVERKYSRYRSDSVTARIHANPGSPIEVDPETASLMDFASQCFTLSEGLFDITSGVLRRAWTFDGSDRIPDTAAVQLLLPLVGFGKLQWQSPRLLLPAGMELDFGGIGKEYAVDRAYDLVAARSSTPFLVNFGGDMRASRPPSHGPWQVGIERPDTDREPTLLLNLEYGALATSGDSRRYLLKDGVRYGAYFASGHRLARARCTPFSDRCSQQLHGSRIACDHGAVAGRSGARVLGRTRAPATGCLNEVRRSTRPNGRISR